MIYLVTLLCAACLALLVAIYVKVSKDTLSNEGIIQVDNKPVLEAIKKARDLILQDLSGKRSHEVAVFDKVADESADTNSKVTFLKNQWERFSGRTN